MAGGIRAVQQAANTNAQSQALREAGRVALWTLGLGAGARGLSGLYGMLSRNVRPEPPQSSLSSVLSLPYPVEEAAPGEEPKRRKAAGVGSYISDLATGRSATTPEAVPWSGLLKVLGGMGGLGLGWKGVDMMLNKRRESERASELDDARQEFHDALIGQYGGPRKVASADDTGPALDRLYDGIVKLASLADTLGQGANMYGVYAGLTGLTSGMLVYDAARKRQRRALLEKAIKKRQQQRFAVNPPEITAMPVPVPQSAAPDPIQGAEFDFSKSSSPRRVALAALLAE